MTAETTRWWWIRHAPVTGNKGRMYGASDPKADIDPADTVYAGLAAQLPEDAVWVASHLCRARDTAAQVAAAGGRALALGTEPDFGEQSFGDWQGQRYTDIPELAGEAAHKFAFAVARHTPPGGESFAMLYDRVSAAIDRHNAAHAGRDIVAVAHGGPIRVAVAHALGLDLDAVLAMSIENLSLTRIEHAPGPGAGGDWRVRCVNFVPRWPSG
jgi:broad specificity phosphatase PhoE